MFSPPFLASAPFPEHRFPAFLPLISFSLLDWTRSLANCSFIFILETFQTIPPILCSATLLWQFIICCRELKTIQSPCSWKGMAGTELNPNGFTRRAAPPWTAAHLCPFGVCWICAAAILGLTSRTWAEQSFWGVEAAPPQHQPRGQGERRGKTFSVLFWKAWTSFTNQL